MTETETESIAALVALGSVLRWEPYKACSTDIGLKFHDLAAPVETGQYFCIENWLHDGWTARFTTKLNTWDAQRNFATIKGAQLACERHNATGKWE